MEIIPISKWHGKIFIVGAILFIVGIYNNLWLVNIIGTIMLIVAVVGILLEIKQLKRKQKNENM